MVIYHSKYHSEHQRGTLGLCCVDISQLMTHPAIKTTPFSLQSCYKILGIPRWVTNTQKVYISNHEALQNCITSNVSLFTLKNSEVTSVVNFISSTFCLKFASGRF